MRRPGRLGPDRSLGQIGWNGGRYFLILPYELDRTIDWLAPDALWVHARRHSDSAYTVWILDVDYSYREWLASLSLDGRWTLSPRHEMLYPTAVVQGQEDLF